MDKACKSNAGDWTLESRDWLNTYMGSYQELEVYKRAQQLFPRVYALVRNWNQLDQREIGSQLIRSANSIHANIAEGHGKSRSEFIRYIGIAIGSCDETRSHLQDARNIGILESSTHEELLREYIIVGKQLMRLKQALKPATRN